MSLPFHLFGRDFLQVQRTPGIADVGEDEGDENGDVAHDFEGEEARRAVFKCQGALQVGNGRVIGRVVPAGAEQEGGDRQDGACPGKPDALLEVLAEEGRPDAAHDACDAYQHQHEDARHGKEVMQVFVWLHVNLCGSGIYGKTVGNQPVYEEDQEEDQEGGGFGQELFAATAVDEVVVDVVDEVEQPQRAGQEIDRQSQADVPEVQDGFQSVPRCRPRRDDRHPDVGQLFLVDVELCPGEERADGGAYQQRTEDAVDHQKDAVGVFPQQVALLRLVFVGNGLEHEAEQDENPDPVGAAEAGGIEEGE